MSRRFGILQAIIIVLTLATACIHFALAPRAGWPFWLNGVGYLVLLLLLYLPAAPLIRYRSIIRWIFIAYTIATIVAWFIFGVRSSIAYIDKFMEMMLVVLLWLEGYSQDSVDSETRSNQIMGDSAHPPFHTD